MTAYVCEWCERVWTNAMSASRCCDELTMSMADQDD